MNFFERVLFCFSDSLFSYNVQINSRFFWDRCQFFQIDARAWCWMKFVQDDRTSRDFKNSNFSFILRFSWTFFNLYWNFMLEKKNKIVETSNSTPTTFRNYRIHVGFNIFAKKGFCRCLNIHRKSSRVDLIVFIITRFGRKGWKAPFWHLYYHDTPRFI